MQVGRYREREASTTWREGTRVLLDGVFVKSLGHPIAQLKAVRLRRPPQTNLKTTDMSKQRALNMSIFLLLQFATWAGVFYVWAIQEDASIKSLFLGFVFPGMVPTFIGLYRDLALLEKEDKKYKCNSWDD